MAETKTRASDRAPRGEQDNETAALPEDVQSQRATGQGEGGGPWPEEYLQRHLVAPQPIAGVSPEQLYTSHEEQPEHVAKLRSEENTAAAQK